MNAPSDNLICVLATSFGIAAGFVLNGILFVLMCVTVLVIRKHKSHKQSKSESEQKVRCIAKLPGMFMVCSARIWQHHVDLLQFPQCCYYSDLVNPLQILSPAVQNSVCRQSNHCCEHYC